uniref:Uncharacterized protein n=1 Tax=Chromera velia CCMP2878 TaxID=1169474 RepID=A0A0G4HT65_9ALVE|eukprot:Cvel_8395.t1-p1 / transcript=Cvel_8395.t1 / gene=Cvel_8395 / organism=Chromera_velia_CCMP2878 / gene_product=P-selectin, putative / transcript_product=P-selectin, putative / location=Cvel_scaffold463:36511-52525(-) / protein_length=2639 / sequence_SO=supercontig / SO=protein_coding / is_pseudo=false
MSLRLHVSPCAGVDLPPSDIGRGDTWTKDTEWEYQGRYSLYKDYTGSTCAGRYRAFTNYKHHSDGGTSAWGTDERPASAAFDRLPGENNQRSGFHTESGVTVARTGLLSSGDGDVELILRLPCSINLEEYSFQLRNDCCPEQGVSKATVHGSVEGSTWTQVGSHSGETTWTTGETKTFTADSSLGPFNFFKFVLQKRSSDSDSWMSIGDIVLHGKNLQTVTDLPPTDIGRGETWTKDPSVLHSSLFTYYRDYTGGTCAGRYRVMRNVDNVGSEGTLYAFGSDEWPFSGIFDRTAAYPNQRSGWHTANAVTNSGTSSGTDAAVEVILKTPCSFTLWSYQIKARSDSSATRCISKATVYGSTDGSSWSQVGSHTGSTGWAAKEVRSFAGDTNLGPFLYFKFLLQKTDSSTDDHMIIGDIILQGISLSDLCGSGSHNCDANAACENTASSFTCACNAEYGGTGVSCSALTLIPPSDIGVATSWTKDPSVNFGGFYTAYRDYSGSTCPGRFRAITNSQWWGDGGWYSWGTHEWPPAGAFDRSGWAHDDSRTGFAPDSSVSVAGTDAGSDSSVEVIIKTPCSIALSQFSLQARNVTTTATADEEPPSKMTVFGSSNGTSWVQLGSFEGEIHWEGSQVKYFEADESLGSFVYFKFTTQRRSAAADGYMSIADIGLWASSVTDLCGSGSHNCDTNAACENTASSFTCTCNLPGYSGDGVSCSALTLVPPSDIGGGGTWTEDSSTTYGGQNTYYKDYSGSECPGRYRAMTNTASYTGNSESWPISGAFDRVAAVAGGGHGFHTGSNNVPGTSDSSDGSVEMILSSPCAMRMVSFAVDARSDLSSSPSWNIQNPSKMTVYGSADADRWTQIGSYEGVIHWVDSLSHSFSTSSSLFFSYFKFVAQRVAQSSNHYMSLGDIELHADKWGSLVPPADIGTATSWTKDPSVTYGGRYSVYKDYSGSVCPGRYRVMCNTAVWDDAGWYGYASDEWPVAGAFDRVLGESNTQAGFHSERTVTISGTGDSSDSNLEIVLKTPCSMILNSWGVESRTATGASYGAEYQTPSKMSVYGSTNTTDWVLLGSFSGETGWGKEEIRLFAVDSFLGPFNYFKFDLQRRSSSSGGYLSLSDLKVYGGSISDLCGGGSHNCDTNAACENTASSFACTCNLPGYSGDGVSCSALTLVPPSDIGRGSTWTEDTSTLYSGLSTYYQDYSGSVCPGRYRAMTNTGSLNANWPVSGAFDGEGVVSNGGNGYHVNTTSISGTDNAADANVEVILETPCVLRLASYGVQSRADTGNYLEKEPSKMTVYGSADMSSWTQIGSYEGVILWSQNETKGFASTASSDFKYFKFVAQRISKAADDYVSLGGIKLFTSNWTEIDECASNVHNCGGNASCTDTAGSFTCVCNNGFSGSGLSCAGLHVNSGGAWGAVSCNESTDTQPNTLGAQVNRTDAGGQTGNTGDTATFIYGCISGFQLDSGGSVSFTCTGTNISTSEWQGTPPTCSDISECSGGLHNCNSNAACTETSGSFTCACNFGFGGDGINCTSLPQVPPSDLGKASSWTKDASVLYHSLHTMYKDYSGTVCPGRYRAMARQEWWENPGTTSWGDNEWPPNGAFDGEEGGSSAILNTGGGGWHSDDSLGRQPGTAAASDGDLQIVLEVPCNATMYWYTMRSKSDGVAAQTPSKSVVYGSHSLSSGWTEIASYSGETGWGHSEDRSFAASNVSSSFTHFAFHFLRNSRTATDEWMSLGEIKLHMDVHECVSNLENCASSGSVCTNTVGSFTCACASGFSGDGLSCSAVSCNETSDPQPNTLSAQVIRTDSGQAGTTTATADFKYSCNNGYTLDGAATVTFTCTGTAYGVSQWQGTPPTCKAVDCTGEATDSQPNTLGAQVTRSDNSQTGSTSDTAVFTYSCNNGYRLDSAGAVTFTCTGTAYGASEWQGTPPTCSAVACNETGDTQPNSLGAQVIRTDSGQSGNTTDTATFTYSCNNGYQLDSAGAVTFTCTATAYAESSWQGTPPTCSAVTCTNETTDLQPNTFGAQVIRTDSGQTGTTTATADFKYSCNNGFTLDGAATVTFTCTGTAYGVSQWQGTPPNCTAVSCNETADSQPNTLGANLTRTDSGQTGSTSQTVVFTYACNRGYSLDSAGAVTFTCTGTAYAASEWQGTPPTCSELDECATGMHNCDSLRTNCTNSVASFSCSCLTGFHTLTTNASNILSCSDVDECSGGLSNCDGNANCTNGVGSFGCQCNAGWEDAAGISDSGTACSDLDECTANNDNCDANAQCTNAVGTFTCACNTGYGGSGVTCTPSSAVLCGTTVTKSGATNQGVAADACGTWSSADAASVPFHHFPPVLESSQMYPVKDVSVSTCNSGTDVDVGLSFIDGLNARVCLASSGVAGACETYEFSNFSADSLVFTRVAEQGGVSGSFEVSLTTTCNCSNSLYDLDGEVCKLDECAKGVHDCTVRLNYPNNSLESVAVCTDTSSSFTCSCNDGYTDASWAGRDAGTLCEAVLCSNVPSIASAGTVKFEDAMNVAGVGASANLSCDPGYALTLTGGGASSMSCTSSGGATAAFPSHTVSCEKTVCGGQTPVIPSGGSMEPSSPPNGVNWLVGDSVAFSCNSGHLQIGVSTLTCEGIESASPAASEWPVHTASCER